MEAIEQVAKIAQDKIDQEAASDPSIKKVLSIVEQFIKTHRVMCYGGTAINNLLPKEDQFYDPERDIPDYDFYSETPQLHAMKLADRISKAGYASVEVKPGVHLGTFKVFADFTGVADISHLDKPIFNKLWTDGLERNGIHYVPVNFLRMSVYLELSRPKGDVSRWKKVYSRLQLLNKHYPMTCPKRNGDATTLYVTSEVRSKIESFLRKEKVVLLGFNAALLQRKTVSNEWSLPLDLLAVPEEIEKTAKDLSEIFGKYANVVVKKYEAYGDLLPAHIDIDDKKTNTTLIRIYETDACHSYHRTSDGLYLASIPTLLQFFLAVLYATDHFLEEVPEQRFLCTAETLIKMANNNLSRRYKLLTPITCIGKQKSMIDMRSEKAVLYEKASQNRESPEFLQYFFSYNPKSTSETKKNKLKTVLRKTIRKH